MVILNEESDELADVIYKSRNFMVILNGGRIVRFV